MPAQQDHLRSDKSHDSDEYIFYGNSICENDDHCETAEKSKSKIHEEVSTPCTPSGQTDNMHNTEPGKIEHNMRLEGASVGVLEPVRGETVSNETVAASRVGPRLEGALLGVREPMRGDGVGWAGSGERGRAETGGRVGGCA